MSFSKTTGHPISRRNLLLTSAAAGVVAGLSPYNSMAATPKRGGHARYGVRGGSTTDSLDPATFSDVFLRTMGYGICNTLTEIDENNTLQPDLLESWEAKPGAKTWIFKLRKGITFHNGKNFDADDVIININHHRGEKSKSGVRKLLGAIAEMTKEDSHTIRFELKSGNADFPYIFADYRLLIAPSKDGKLYWQDGIGTGGYVMKSFEPGVSATLERNKDYWRSDRAFFDSAEVITMADVTARQNALMTGSIDIIDQVDLKTVNLLKRAPNVNVKDTAGGLHYTYGINTTLDPYTSNDLRLAMKYGVDRKALLKKILNGYGSLGNDHPIASNMQYFDNSIPQRSFDPDKAKFHLKKAGLDSHSATLHVSDFLYAGAVDGATLYKEQLADCGIDLKVAREPSDGYFSNIWKKKPFFASYWSSRPTADIMFSTAYAGGAPWNDTSWSNDRFNKLLVEARTELDQTKRGGMYAEMQRLVRDSGGNVVPLFASNVFAMSKNVVHPQALSGAWELDGGRSMERWWFA
jgi:peptide/nickel transport system substrate-binding protein